MYALITETQWLFVLITSMYFNSSIMVQKLIKAFLKIKYYKMGKKDFIKFV